ncbi:DUF4190 domain-containing protein [Spirillospora sp. NPDC049024]
MGPEGELVVSDPNNASNPGDAPAYRLATASMVLGVLGFLPFGQFAVVAIVMGHVARRRIRRTGEGGRGRATAGLVLGYLFTCLWAGIQGTTVWAYGVAFHLW